MFRLSREKRRLEDWASFESEALPFHLDLYRLAKWLLRDQTEAEDLVQETFVAALRSFHRYEKGTNCRAWLIKIMYHTLSKRRRSSNRLRVVSDLDEPVEEKIAAAPARSSDVIEEEVLSALKRLPQHYQEVVILSDIQDMTYKEIADALSIPTGTVMSRLHRGRSLLRGELAGYARSYGIGVAKESDEPKLRLAEGSEGGKSNAV
jgi:RNA polymerase sigma-70 factor (ECF subfamily)